LSCVEVGAGLDVADGRLLDQQRAWREDMIIIIIIILIIIMMMMIIIIIVVVVVIIIVIIIGRATRMVTGLMVVVMM
jgi:hypothetical protein